MGVIAPKEGQGGSVISSPGSPAPITYSSGQEKNLLLSVSLRGPKGEQGLPGGVSTVNGLAGNVVLDAEDVGADPTGSAVGVVATHEAAADPHPQYERNLIAGTNVVIDRTDPANPVISATGGGGGAVDSVNGQTGAVDLSGSYVPLSHEGSGGTAHANAVAGGAAGFMTGADKTKLDGIATGATANSTDAALRDRSTHTGTQAASTISDLTEVTQDMVGAMIVAGTNVSVSYDDVAGTLTISASGGGGSVVGACQAAFDGGGSDISVGSACEIRMPYAMTISKVTVLGDAAGSISVDVRVDSLANYPPLAGDSIVGASPPQLSGSASSEDSTLSGWTTAIAAGSVLRFVVSACSGIGRATVIIEGVRS